MKVDANRPILPSDLAEELCALFGEGCAARRDHFGYQQARKDAVLFGHVAADGQAGAFFSADGDFVLCDTFADVFETNGRLVERHAMLPGYCIDKVRCRDAA